MIFKTVFRTALKLMRQCDAKEERSHIDVYSSLRLRL